MTVRRIFAVFVTVLLLAGSAFAFPFDTRPSSIQDTGGGIPGFNGFDGNWVINFGSMVNADYTRLHQFTNVEFNALGGRGGAKDLEIWNTPSFNAYRDGQQAAAWNFLLDNPPGTAVPETIGRAWYTTQEELVNFIQNMPTNQLTVEYLGEIPRGFPFAFLIFSRNNTDRTPDGLRATGKPLVWIQCLIHGGEWSGAEGILSLANDLARGKHNNLLDKVNVIIVPRVCADGGKAPRRETRDLQALQWTPQPEARDLNRDNMLLDLPVTRAMRKMFLAYGPHFCADLHERSGQHINATLTNTFGVKIDNDGGDIGSSGTTILQAPRDLIRLRYEYMEPDQARIGAPYGITFGLYREGTDSYAEGGADNYTTNGASSPTWVPPFAGAAYGAGGLTSFVTNTAWDPDAPYFVIPEATYNTRSSRNINSMPGVVSLLFENKNPGGGRITWERRVATGYICGLATITTVAEKGDELLPKIMEIRRRNIEQGKTVTPDDMVPILTVQPRPTHWNAGSDAQKDGAGNAYLANFGYRGREVGYTVVDLGIAPVTNPRDLTGVVRYDGTKALRKRVPNPTSSADYEPLKGGPSSDGYHQMFKFEATWLGWNLRERMRPYAYIFEGPYANELATRMMVAGIEVKRLAQDTKIDVEGWKYLQRPYVDLANSGSSGWLNRNVDIYTINNREFKKDAFVVYLSQVSSNLIPMYFEPDLPWNVASCIFLPYMSVAAGGASTGSLSESIVGKEMPAYRYVKTVDLPTYDVDHFLPLVNRGAVARFFNYHTKESIAAVAAACGEKFIKVYDYDFQVHTRTDALREGRFDITLPTSKGNKGYLILKKDGTYEPLIPKARKTAGWDVATVVVANHGNVPFTVNISADGRPVVGDGSNRTVPRALPANDDLIGVRIVEIFENPFKDLFKDGILPPGAVLTEKGIEYPNMLQDRAVLLDESMLNGWRIVKITPPLSPHWTTKIENGVLNITFHGDSYNQSAVVTLENIVTKELVEMEIQFSGEGARKNLVEDIIDGCNAGFAALAFFALIPFLLRRKS